MEWLGVIVRRFNDDKGTPFGSQIYSDGAPSPPNDTYDSKASTADKYTDSESARG